MNNATALVEAKAEADEKFESPSAPPNVSAQGVGEQAVESKGEIAWWERADQLAELGNRAVVVASAAEGEIVARVNAKLEKGDFPLPVLPFTLLKAIELSNQAEPDLRELAQCVRTDAVIAGEVMSLVNSVAYSPATPIKDLHRAVVHVGTRRSRSLMIGVAARLTVFRNVDSQRGQQLWAHSLGCAVLARAIARASACDPEEAFLAGLLHDIGKTVVLGLVADGERATPPVRVPELLIERLYEETHSGVGRRIADQWKLNAGLCDAIEQHHGLNAKSSPLVAIVALANDVCGTLGLGVLQRRGNLGKHKAFSILGMEEFKGRKLLELLPAVIEESPEFRGVMAKLK